MTQDQIEIAKLRAENAQLKAKQSQLSFRIGPKGGLSVYGLGRFPVTLYRDQWERLLEAADQIKAFIRTNRDDLE